MKTVWIVDGAYLFNYGRNRPFDYLKLKAEITRANGGPLHECYYLNSTPDAATESQNAFHSSVQKGVDVGIATLIVKLAAQGVYDRLILSAGDGDFQEAITYIKSELHKEFWLHGAMSNLSTDLQCYADQVLWMDDMHPAIDKDKPAMAGAHHHAHA